ncbi:ABC transporter ATP-binding protein [Schaalia suimastitidis]|uniref:ABC transporter ATP-binding protein n=1 Tax=Schaalia suimastitidis TaxID=121163 RepID=UPI000479143F|nr:ABC transporter ATP-binding protein [Schaalia suimastitidis]
MRAAIALLAPHLKKHKGLIFFGTLALLLDVVFRVLEPWPLKIVIDSILSAQGIESSGPKATLTMLVVLGGLQVLIVAARAACNYLSTTAFATVGSRAAASLRKVVFSHVQGLSQQFHARNRSADTVQRIVSDVARMQEVAVTAGLPLVANMTTLVVMLGVMAVLDPILAIVVVVAVALFALSTSGISRRITEASRKSRAGEGHLANTAQESLSSIKLIQAYGLESFIERRFAGANKSSMKASISSLQLAARLERGTDVIVGMALAAVIVGGGIRVMGSAMTIGELVVFITYLKSTMKPLRDMAKYTGRISRANASAERVADLLATRNEIVEKDNAMHLNSVAGDIIYDHVSTAYDGHQILNDVSLRITPGEHVALVGPSGAGKSTFMSLLVRSQDPTSGRVLLDGKNLTDVSLTQLRSQVTMLHQDAVLLAGTIRDNIAIGDSNATQEDIENAARAANAHHFITELPDGYDTVVGERGGTLSGGQRQRIAIARALLRNSPVICLDEATTGLDPEATTQVLEALDVLIQGRTTLSVTHQSVSALRASRVLWIDNGQVLLDGTPTELLETSQLFRDWVDADTGTKGMVNK